MDNIQYGHARNNHPAPPITITVEQGVIVSFQIEKEAIETYTGGEISSLFEAAGVGPGRILMPIPDRFMGMPLFLLRFNLNPGKYEVEHLGESLRLPESAFSFSVMES